MRGDWLSDPVEKPKAVTSVPVLKNPDADIVLHLDKALLCLSSCYCAQIAFKAIAHAPKGTTLIESPAQCDSVVKLLRQGYRNEVAQVVDGVLVDAIVDSSFANGVDQSAKYLLESQQDSLFNVVNGVKKDTPLCVQTLETTHQSERGRGDGGWQASLGFEGASSMRIAFDERCELLGSDRMKMTFPRPPGKAQVAEVTRTGKQWDAIEVESNVICQHVNKQESSSVFGVKFTATATTDTAFVESKHEYEPNCDYTGSVQIRGAMSLLVKFDSHTRTEGGCDHLRFYASSPADESNRSEPTRELSGDSNFTAFKVKGDILHWRFYSDCEQTNSKPLNFFLPL